MGEVRKAARGKICRSGSPAARCPSWRGVGPVRRRGVGQLAEEFVEYGLSVVDGGALLVGEGDGGEHALEVVFGF
jgi:hypothetical protein